MGAATACTASGQMLEDKGEIVLAGSGENGQQMRVRGRATAVHKPLVSAARTLRGKIGVLTAQGGIL
eukprot:689667-Amphidinium_carterae.2